MAERKQPNTVATAEELFARVEEARICRVRYGRARLSIARWGRLADSPIAEVLDAWRDGKKSAEEVAWVFVRHRVEDQSPSFSWETADLERLLKLVTECASDPEISARAPQDLAVELQEHREEEERSLREAGEAVRRAVERALPQWPKPVWTAAELSRQFGDQVALIDKLNREFGAQSSIGKLAETVNRQLADIDPFARARHQIAAAYEAEKIDRYFAPLLSRLSEAAPTIELLAGERAIRSAAAANNLWMRDSVQAFLGDELLTSLEDAVKSSELRELAAEGADLAREANDDEAANALESTAEAVEQVEVAPSPEAIQEAMRPLLEELRTLLEQQREASSQLAAAEGEGSRPNPWLIAVVTVLLSYLLRILGAELGLPPTP